MMTEHFEPRRFEVWHVRYPYEDDPSQSKKRPALVIQERAGRIYALMLKITGNTWRYAPHDVPILDWRAAGLRKPCVVRCDKVARITSDDIVWDDTPLYGRLTPTDAMRVLRGLRDAQQSGAVKL